LCQFFGLGVSLQDGALVISGERKAEKVEDGVEIHRQERFYGKFQRALTLPAPVAADKVKAQYKDGVLTVTLPKAEEAKPKQIDVSVN
jgi:HSP20 family protein